MLGDSFNRLESMIKNPQIINGLLTGIVLAGGRGERMGGRNKGLIEVDGKPLVTYAAANLLPHVQQLLVNTNSDAKRYRQLGFEVIDDGEFAWQGPLAGILAGVRAASTPFIALSACDQLSLPGDIYPTLLAAAQQNPAGLAVACDNERMHPTCAVVSAGCEGALQQQLEQGLLRAGWWFKQMGAAEICFPEAHFYNLNTPMDLIKLAGR